MALLLKSSKDYFYGLDSGSAGVAFCCRQYADRNTGNAVVIPRISSSVKNPSIALILTEVLCN